MAIRAERATGYNLEVAEDHTYFVGRSEIWVHNQCSTIAKFANPKTLREHHNKHVVKGNEWGQQFSSTLYEKRAQQFFSRPANSKILEYTRSNGDTVRVNSQTGEFGILSPSTNVIRTLFRPAMSKLGNGVEPVQYFLQDRFRNLGY